MNPLLIDLLFAMSGFALSGGVDTVSRQFDTNPANNPSMGEWLRVFLATAAGAALPSVAGGIDGGLGGGGAAAGDAAADSGASAIEEAASHTVNQPLPLKPLTSFTMQPGVNYTFPGGEPAFGLPINANRLEFSPTTGAPFPVANFSFRPPPLAQLPQSVNPVNFNMPNSVPISGQFQRFPFPNIGG